MVRVKERSKVTRVPIGLEKLPGKVASMSGRSRRREEIHCVLGANLVSEAVVQGPTQKRLRSILAGKGVLLLSNLGFPRVRVSVIRVRVNGKSSL